ncbi:hypothetical protein MPC1_1470001 [Methylocella tundrae]|nr:hypothetical protein MPC1_1470001 [Methylocella tundrae]
MSANILYAAASRRGASHRIKASSPGVAFEMKMVSRSGSVLGIELFIEAFRTRSGAAFE